MSVSALIIRKHSRFAMCHQANLRRAGGRFRQALLVEVSLDGCRLSNLGKSPIEVGQHASVRIDGFGMVEVVIRGAKDGFVSLRFDRPLFTADLNRLIQTCRPTRAPQLEPQALCA